MKKIYSPAPMFSDAEKKFITYLLFFSFKIKLRLNRIACLVKF